MSEAANNDGVGDQSPGTPDLPLRPAAPARPSDVGPLRAEDPVRVGDYRLLGQLGIGGMGTVYLGQAPDGLRVAVKLVHVHLARDPRFRIRFAGEVRAAQRVPGFCTARVLDSGIFEDRPYLVTEYLEGIPLSRLVADDGPLDPAMLHGVALGVAAALAAIHGVGLVHRDLKPSNLMITLGGVRIIDFGIARALDVASDVTGTGNIVGSLGWASPEQLRAEEPKPSMDIFGWGCLVAFAATGQHPFGGDEAAARAWKILEGEPNLSGIPDPLHDLVAVALDRDPRERLDARQLLMALAVGDMTIPPAPTGRRWLHPGSGGRRRATTMAIAVPMALALVFAVAATTSELMGGRGGVADAGAPGGGDSAMINMLSPKAGPPSPSVITHRDRPNTITYGPTTMPTVGLSPGNTLGALGGATDSPTTPGTPSATATAPATSATPPPPTTDPPTSAPPPTTDPPTTTPIIVQIDPSVSG
jgi:serine/threonine protein kinase